MRVPIINSYNSKITAIIHAACDFRNHATGIEFDAELITKNVLSHGQLDTLQLLAVVQAYMHAFEDSQLSAGSDPYGLNA